MAKFTAEEAFELQGTDDAIMLDIRAAQNLIAKHGADWNEFIEDGNFCDFANPVDAGHVLAWLGY